MKLCLISCSEGMFWYAKSGSSRMYVLFSCSQIPSKDISRGDSENNLLCQPSGSLNLAWSLSMSALNSDLNLSSFTERLDDVLYVTWDNHLPVFLQICKNCQVYYVKNLTIILWLPPVFLPMAESFAIQSVKCGHSFQVYDNVIVGPSVEICQFQIIHNS